MSKIDKLILKILSGSSDKNISFDELRRVLDYFSFEKRIKGSHHIYYRKDFEEILNIQPLNDRNAKPYQVKQVREVILKHRLMLNMGKDE